MVYLLPTSLTDSWYEQTVLLDGVAYRIRLAWAERDHHWYLDLETVSGFGIMYGKKVVADRPLTERLAMRDRPAGEIWCLDTTGAGIDPDLRDLGGRCVLIYVGASSV